MASTHIKRQLRASERVCAKLSRREVLHLVAIEREVLASGIGNYRALLWAATEGRQAISAQPRRFSFDPRISTIPAPRSLRSLSEIERKLRPSFVMPTPRVVRSSNRTPSARSSSRTLAVTAGCERPIARYLGVVFSLSDGDESSNLSKRQTDYRRSIFIRFSDWTYAQLLASNQWNQTSAICKRTGCSWETRTSVCAAHSHRRPQYGG